MEVAFYMIDKKEKVGPLHDLIIQNLPLNGRVKTQKANYSE